MNQSAQAFGSASLSMTNYGNVVDRYFVPIFTGGIWIDVYEGQSSSFGANNTIPETDVSTIADSYTGLLSVTSYFTSGTTGSLNASSYSYAASTWNAAPTITAPATVPLPGALILGGMGVFWLSLFNRDRLS